MSAPSIHPALLIGSAFGTPAERATDRMRHAKAHLRSADHALRVGNVSEAIEALEAAKERLTRAQQILEGKP